MKVFELKKDLEAHLIGHRKAAKSIGLVPTMGALHTGHLALIKQALIENDIVVVTIFVNPTQFNNSDDLKKYPRNLEADINLLNTLKSTNISLYAPTVEDVYPKGIISKSYELGAIEFVMEGKFRPGHFQGVATIVDNLFNIVKPNKAYFGEKDYQQLQIIHRLVEITNQTLKIIPCSILRESDGLAMSSRNQRLTPAHRKMAPFIFQTLLTAKKKFGTKSANEVIKWVTKEFNKNNLLELEYFSIADQTTLKPVLRKQKNKKYRAFVAAFAGDIRLIDNIALN